MLEKVMNMSLNTTSKNKLEKEMMPRKGTELPLTKWPVTLVCFYTPWKYKKINSFWCFFQGVKKETCGIKWNTSSLLIWKQTKPKTRINWESKTRIKSTIMGTKIPVQHIYFFPHPNLDNFAIRPFIFLLFTNKYIFHSFIWSGVHCYYLVIFIQWKR